jgi:hypothetical protein
MNRAMTITIDTHVDDYNSQHGKTCSQEYCWRFIPLFAGAASDRINQIISR